MDFNFLWIYGQKRFVNNWRQKEISLTHFSNHKKNCLFSIACFLNKSSVFPAGLNTKLGNFFPAPPILNLDGSVQRLPSPLEFENFQCQSVSNLKNQWFFILNFYSIHKKSCKLNRIKNRQNELRQNNCLKQKRGLLGL
jgi:hypothetical protein